MQIFPNNLITYRCTRNTPYVDDIKTFTDPNERQGYYIKAITASEAIAVMRRNFPNDEAGFTINYWDGRKTPESLKFISNTAHPNKLELVAQVVEAKAGQSLQEAIEEHLIWIADNYIGKPHPTASHTSDELQTIGFVGIYAQE